MLLDLHILQGIPEMSISRSDVQLFKRWLFKIVFKVGRGGSSL